ncbi:hypothetical protein V5O48_002799 [Marasmius crinis-equi]|uniref:Cytochrome P450 n=1 Tax=Marasmius crinis-equi TaxID=585013 RepID=A0ABR3FUN8_9AGAR
MQEDRLLISDPKAANHILQGYRWGGSKEQRARGLFFAGPNVSVVQGDDHKRHRRIMNPAFGPAESRALVPIFSSAASSLSTKWKDLLSVSKDESEVLNIPKWTSRATLDAIGHAGFDYNFGAMENQNDRLSTVYNNLFADMFAAPSDRSIVIGALSSFIPLNTMARLLERLSMSDPRLARGRIAREVAREVAKELVSEKSKEIGNGQGSHLKDIMSLLLKANMSPQNERNRMNDEELFAQMLAIFFAGHETTSTSVSWTLLELSRRPEIQNKLRKEIHGKECQIISEGRTGFTAEDFDSLPYLNAVLKESLRYHPAAIRISKVATVDDCIPLSEPIRTAGGKEINEIPVRKGQKVMLSIGDYNRNEAIFGEDAHAFKPERWLEKEKNGSQLKKSTTAGVYANLLTFSGGVRSCIGWRFAVLELQAFVVELISNFEFSLTPECDKIRREACGVMLPTMEGELEKGVQCPLRVRCARRDIE